MTDDWITRFPGLAALSPDVRDVLVGQSAIVEVPKGTRIFGPGQSPEHLLLLLDGAVRVHQTSEQGREIVLYRVNAGESCVLTTACMLAYEDYSAEGHADTDVRAVAIPRVVFDDLVSRSVPFRNFVFAAYAQRITDLFHVIEEIAFQRLDIRLAQRLLTLAGDGDAVAITHQDLAVELGTAREVISRQLAEFQRRGWVAQSRGRVTLLDPDAIAGLAQAA
ncbi:cyclic nucleotide-binding protein [Loktanella fryxellensis]|uniref:Cyclic nucleotide-binding protein n=1 Tax=Loktanella fryxellensis TaxID=245187 RepID=A0A1H8EH61_9RHOB|nr:Crp/Fnr family transcriptional regulator [Loktanella fryxellensis]SEN18118.1 cyclic nucleotide-binding protein [Loktanella fryxellensis]